ncbi:MAG: DUF5916 domain-containing protein [Chitinophagaceae bacterium]
MAMRAALILFLQLFFSIFLFAQNVIKQLPAKRTTSVIKIDGIPDEAAWKEAIPATDFVEFKPTPGRLEDSANKTVVYLLYDNTSVYVGGFCYERTRDSISRELIGRDKVGINDFVGVILDTYYDRINAVGFYVTPYGEQYDAKYSSAANGEDGSWNAVWDSEAKIHDNGWSFEMRIPYSALRFNSKEVQTWGINITRRRNKTGQQYMWNPLNMEVNGFINQEGEWTGIQRIKPPLRLSVSPYFSTYVNHYPYKTAGFKNVRSSVNGGMDVKYGLNESFTLDMTLIPDFGQVQSDNQVLNLSPFEIRFDENRSFFTEGTELFSKGNLFYSRRIGARPLHFYSIQNQLDINEKVIENPVESKLLNATKISGRTKNGLGIGFFNAITKPMYAVVEDGNKNSREIQTNPLTNFNIIVLDQSLKNNSSVSFINTNVLRSGTDYDANVSAAVFNFNNKKNTYNWSGKVAVSNLTGERASTGYSHRLGFGKTGGRFNYQLNQELVDDKYQINDMGLMFFPNYFDHNLWLGYKWIKPGKWFNQLRINNNYTYSRRFAPSSYQHFYMNFNANAQLKNLWMVGSWVGYNADANDFYEPNMRDRFFRSPGRVGYEAWVETNNAKKYAAMASFYMGKYKMEKGRSYSFSLRNRYRFNDKLSMSLQSSYRPFTNNVGFNSISGSEVIFALRDRVTIENVLNAKYNFNNRSGLTFRARHYWSEVINKSYYMLNADGSLTAKNGYSNSTNRNFNIFNIDMVYTLQFAPGSFINIVWKNEIFTNNQQTSDSYFRNFDRTISSPRNNNLSLKVLYFLDYVDFKKWRKRDLAEI